MIKAVFFDFDETLQDRTAAFERYMDGFFARFFPGVTGGELAEKKHQMRQSGNGGYVDRVEWYKGLIALWHWADAPAAEALAEHYDRTFGDCCVIFPDAVPMLQALRKKGIVTGVITNGPSYLQNHKMDESGLRPFLDLVVVSGEDKADALKATICGPITPQVPASILQLHNDVTIVADEAALSKMDI